MIVDVFSSKVILTADFETEEGAYSFEQTPFKLAIFGFERGFSKIRITVKGAKFSSFLICAVLQRGRIDPNRIQKRQIVSRRQQWRKEAILSQPSIGITNPGTEAG